MRLNLHTAPAALPLTMDQVKAYARIDGTADDAEIGALISAAVGNFDSRSGILRRALITQTWELSRDSFADQMRLPFPPLQRVDQITYTDTGGVLQTLAGSVYDVDTREEPGVITRAYNQTWPVIRDQRNAVTIRFTCGYGDSLNDVPEDLRIAMMQWITWQYEQRTGVNVGNIVNTLPFSYQSIIRRYRVRRFDGGIE